MQSCELERILRKGRKTEKEKNKLRPGLFGITSGPDLIMFIIA